MTLKKLQISSKMQEKTKSIDMQKVFKIHLSFKLFNRKPQKKMIGDSENGALHSQINWFCPPLPTVESVLVCQRGLFIFQVRF